MYCTKIIQIVLYEYKKLKRCFFYSKKIPDVFYTSGIPLTSNKITYYTKRISFFRILKNLHFACECAFFGIYFQ